MRRGIACIVALAASVAIPSFAQVSGGTQQYMLDAEKSDFSFRVRMFYGPMLQGTFRNPLGQMFVDANGRRKAIIELPADGIDVNGNRMLSGIARSGAFFGAKDNPVIRYESEWHDADVLQRGGSVNGDVTIRGVRNAETFRITPARCERPALECPVEAKGSVNRRTYGIGDGNTLLAPEVELTMTVQFDPRVR